MKKLNYALWSKPDQIINAYIYFNNKKKDIFKESLIPRIQLEKDEKDEKSWII